MPISPIAETTQFRSEVAASSFAAEASRCDADADALARADEGVDASLDVVDEALEVIFRSPDATATSRLLEASDGLFEAKSASTRELGCANSAEIGRGSPSRVVLDV